MQQILAVSLLFLFFAACARRQQPGAAGPLFVVVVSNANLAGSEMGAGPFWSNNICTDEPRGAPSFSPPAALQRFNRVVEGRGGAGETESRCCPCRTSSRLNWKPTKQTAKKEKKHSVWSSANSPNSCAAPCPSRLYENKGEADFMESLRNLFTSFNDMMNSSSENTGMVKVGWPLCCGSTSAGADDGSGSFCEKKAESCDFSQGDLVLEMHVCPVDSSCL